MGLSSKDKYFSCEFHTQTQNQNSAQTTKPMCSPYSSASPNLAAASLPVFNSLKLAANPEHGEWREPDDSTHPALP